MQKVIIMAAAVVVAALGAASAEMSAGSNSPATQAYMQAMQTMDDTMKAMKPTGDPDKDFVMMMKPHHQAAVDMAQAYLKHGKDPLLTRMAKAIIASQDREIQEMTAWQAKHGM